MLYQHVIQGRFKLNYHETSGRNPDDEEGTAYVISFVLIGIKIIHIAQNIDASNLSLDYKNFNQLGSGIHCTTASSIYSF